MAKFDYMPRPDQIYGLPDTLVAANKNLFSIPGTTSDATPKRRLETFSPSGATVTVNTVTGPIPYIVMDQDCTISLDKFAARGYQEVLIMIDPATFTETWGDTISWVSGAPTLTASKLNIIKLYTIDSWATIFGDTVALGLTFSPSTTTRPIAAYAFYWEDVEQFNMITETHMTIAVHAIDSHDEELRPFRGTMAANLTLLGCAVLIGGASPMSIYTYATNSPRTTGSTTYEPPAGNPPSIGVKPDTNHQITAFGYNSTFVSIDVTTFTKKFTNISIATDTFTYGACFSHPSFACFSAGNSNIGNDVYWSSEAISAKVLPETWYTPEAYSYDQTTDLGYILGGTDAGGITDDIVRRNATDTFTQLSNILPAVGNTNRGQAADGIAIWACRDSGSFKFTISTETAAVDTNISVAMLHPAIVHGDTYQV